MWNRRDYASIHSIYIIWVGWREGMLVGGCWIGNRWFFPRLLAETSVPLQPNVQFSAFHHSLFLQMSHPKSNVIFLEHFPHSFLGPNHYGQFPSFRCGLSLRSTTVAWGKNICQSRRKGRWPSMAQQRPIHLPLFLVTTIASREMARWGPSIHSRQQSTSPRLYYLKQFLILALAFFLSSFFTQNNIKLY